MSAAERRLELAENVHTKIAVDQSGGWLWTASRGSNGYAQVWADGTMRRAHRVVYERLIGPIPGGLELDHTCKVRHCVNPDHLEPVTHAENQRRRRKYPQGARGRQRAYRQRKRIESGWWVVI